MFTLATIGFQEIVLVGIVLFLFFGARKLPELARSMGSSVNEFKRGLKDGQENSTQASSSSAKDTGSQQR